MGGEWKTLSLDKCAELVRDSVHPSEVGSIPYIGLEHIAQNQLTLAGHGTAEQVTSIKTRFSDGDILFGKLRPYFRKVILAPFEGICSTDIWVVRPKSGINNRYLFYWMASQEFIDQSNQGSEGTRMPRAKWNFVSKIERSVPPLKEQEAIASILGALDDKIEINRQMNERLEGIGVALFKSWFVDFDPVHAKAKGDTPAGLKAEIADLFPDSFQDSDLGPIPKGWKVEALDSTAQFLNGLALRKYPAKTSEVLPVIKIAQMRTGNTMRADICSAAIPDEYVINNGDILFSWSGSLECMLWCGGLGALNQHLFKVTSEKYPKWFCYYWIHHYLPDFRHIAASKATTMGHIQRHHLSAAKTIIPCKEIFYLSDKLLTPIINRVIEVDLESRSLASLRDTLLPQLLSGELRVADAERIVARMI